jgi:hypothetical protein
MIKKVGRGIYAFVVALGETFTVSFYHNLKKHYQGPNTEYKEVKVPRGYVDSKLEPEFKEIQPDTQAKDEEFKGVGELWN